MKESSFMNKTKGGFIVKKRIIMLTSVLVLSLLIVGVCLFNNFSSNRQQQEHKVEELVLNEGQYDAQSIVLKDTNKNDAEKFAKLLNAKLRITSNGTFATLTLPDGLTILDVYQNEDYEKYLDRFSIDYQVHAADVSASKTKFTGTDRHFNRQTYLDYINIGKTWDYTIGSNITIAVIDTGIDTDHEEFSNIISEYSYNATEDKIVKDYLLESGVYDWSLVEDEQGHGTAVIGVIAAQSNGIGITGIAPGVEVISIKAECDEDGTFKRTSDLVFGIYYAIEQNVDIINMSFGMSQYNPFEEALALARNSDIVCVAAGGNDGSADLVYPAADENVIGVGALKEDSFELASYSNYGENIDLVAPGTVYTTKMDGQYGVMNGTSFAAPIVSSTIALFMASPYQGYVAYDAIVDRLYASSIDLGVLGKDAYYGYGVLDVETFTYNHACNVEFNYLTDELINTTSLFIPNRPLQELPEPERPYYLFDGWYYDIHCTEEVNYYEDRWKDHITLYAKWVNESDVVPFEYNVNENNEVVITNYIGSSKYISVPDLIDNKPVVSIGDGAFAGNTKLRKVILPDTLKVIGEGAFSGCFNLTDINIPDAVISIGISAFAECIRLNTITLNASSSLETISDFAFEDCASIQAFYLPKKLKNVSGLAFIGTTRMKRYDVSEQNPYFKSEDGILYNYTKSAVVAYPALKNDEVSLAGSVQKIGDGAFAYANVDHLFLSNIGEIGRYAFAYSELSSLELSNQLNKLGEYAFANCQNLKAINLGEAISTIPTAAFMGCTSLEEINIPKNVYAIGDFAFIYSGLNNISFAFDSKLQIIAYSAFANSDLQSLHLPSTLMIIGPSAFANNPLLTEVVFEDNSQLQHIGDEAFKKAVSLLEINLPSNLQTIGRQAFYQSGLTGIIGIPASVNSIGDGAFALNNNLDVFEVTNSDNYISENGVLYSIDKKQIIAYPSGNSSSTFEVIPSVESIGNYAFAGANNLTKVVLAENVKTIGEYAFYDCENLAECVLNQKLENIEAYAFSYTNSLKNITLPKSLIQIGRYAFDSSALSSVSFAEDGKLARISEGAFANTKLWSVTIPASVSTLSKDIFDKCEALQYVYFAENSQLRNLPAHVFGDCSDLQKVVFSGSNSLESVNAYALENHENLQLVDFGDANLLSIGNFAFRNSLKLSSITIPETVESIGRYAFYNCKALASLTIPSSVQYIGQYAFANTQENVITEIYFESETLPRLLQENWNAGIKGYYIGVSEIIHTEELDYALLANGNISIIKYHADATTLDLNELQLGGAITSIGGYAFYNSTVEEVVLPDTLVNIAQYAFAHSKIKSINIPNSVEFIGEYAFNFTPLTEIVYQDILNAKLRIIERYAFANTNNLTEVELPKTLEGIGSYAFYNSGLQSVSFADEIKLATISEGAFQNTKLKSVSLPDSIQTLASSAFRNITTLEEVTFGETNMYIFDNVFYNTGIERVYIPQNLEFIGEYSFVGLVNLTEFVVAEDNPYYQAIDGVLFSKDGKHLIAFPAGRTGSYEVPKHVEEIGYGAFENSKLSSITFNEQANILTIGYRTFFNADSLTEITIPDSVVTLGYYALAYCDGLKRVNLSDNSKLQELMEGTFYACKNLTDISLPDKIVEIKEYAFYGCRNMTTLPLKNSSQVKIIGEYAFAYSGISKLVLPDTILEVANYAFLGSNLVEAYITNTNAYNLKLGIGIFEECYKLQNLTIPFIGSVYEDKDITWLGYLFGAGNSDANATCVPKSLKEVTILEGISFIGFSAFDDLNNLAILNLPNSINAIYGTPFINTKAQYTLNEAVSYYNYLGEIDYLINGAIGKGYKGTLIVNENINTVSKDALVDCFNLEEVIFAGEITSLGSFENCVNLKNVEFLKGVSDSLVLPEYLFNNCTSLEAFVIPSTVETIPTYAFGNTGIKELTIPASVKSIDRNAIINNKELVKVNFEDGSQITEIAMLTFANCHQLKEINLPNTVLSIGARAFENCSALAEITLPSALTSIANGSFTGCVSLFTIHNNSLLDLELQTSTHGAIALYAKTIYNGDGSVEWQGGTELTYLVEHNFRFIKQGEVYTLIAYLGVEEEVILPNAIAGFPYHIALNNQKIKQITIPAGISVIDANAFTNCQNLETVKMADDVITIGDSAFKNCSNLKYIELSNQLLTIEQSAFENCNNLETVIFPETLLTIDNEAFYNCTSLKDVVLPNGITSLGYSAFGNCLSLNSVTVPNSIKKLHGTFAGCQNLRSVTLNEGLEIISINTFKNCQNLRKIDLPNTVYLIESNAFQNCSSLTSIYLSDTLLNVADDALDGCEALEYVYIGKNISNMHFNLPSCQYDISPENTAFYASDEAIYSADKTILYYVDKDVTEFTILDTVNKLGDGAFKGCQSLESISIPQNVRLVGLEVFADCHQLMEVIFEDTTETPAEILEINSEMFRNCTALKQIHLPASITQIGSYAFSGCNNLEEVTFAEDTELYTIFMYAFDGCTKLGSIELPRISSLSNDAFSGCDNLEIVKIAEDSTITTIDSMVFGSLKELHLPRSIESIKDGILDVEKLYYYGMIEEWCNISFEWTSSLRNVKQLYVLNDSALEFVSHLVIPEGVKTIANKVFSGYDALVSVTLPTSLISIGSNVFTDCYNLEVIHNNSNLDLNIGSKEYGDIALYAKVIHNFDGSIEQLDDKNYIYIDTADGFRFVNYDGKYELIDYIGSLEEITLPLLINGNTYEINFHQSGNLKTVIIPEGMTSVDGFAYSNLEYIVISSSVTQIEDSCFQGCDSLKGIVFETNSKLTKIGERAFSGCNNLESIIIPASVESIGWYAFNSCNKLIDIEFEAGSKCAFIGLEAFSNTAYYKDLDNWENGLLYIDNALVGVDENLNDVFMKPSTIVAAIDVFSNCHELNSLTIYGKNSFTACQYLSNLTTLIMNDMPEEELTYYLTSGVQLTLRNVVMLDSVIMTDDFYTNVKLFEGIEEVNIFIEKAQEELTWDYEYKGWNNGNKVYYKGEWSQVSFYGFDKQYIVSEYVTNSQVIRQPYLEFSSTIDYNYEFIGWDLDGDGLADIVPATTNVSFEAYAVVNKATRNYHVTYYDSDGKTIIYQYELPYGTVVDLPETPMKLGYTFIEWIGYQNGMVVEGDLNFYASWKHNNLGHLFTTEEVVEPTCVTNGYTKHICEICQEYYISNIVMPLGHDYLANIVSSTCEEAGYTEHVCQRCGDTYHDSIVDALGHQWYVLETKAATCLETGYVIYGCHRDSNHSYTEVINPLDHNYVGEIIEDSTCQKVGQIRYTCTRCGDEIDDIIPVKDHTYYKVYTTKHWLQILIELLLNIFFGYDGDKPYYHECSVCGHIQTVEEYTLFGSSSSELCVHELSDWYLALDAKCEEKGVYCQKCVICDEVIVAKTIPAIGYHEHGDWIEVVTPTCVSEGVKGHYHCHVCDTYFDKDFVKISDLDIPMLEHNWSNWQITVESTCTDVGVETRICEDCGTTEERDVPIINHKYEALIIAATCLEQGYTLHTCDYCGDTYIDEYTDPKGHDYGAWEVVNEPTTEATGLLEKVCLNDSSHKETMMLEYLNEYDYDYELVAMFTCEKDGLEKYSLAIDNQQFTFEVTLKAVGHYISDWYDGYPATCEEEGLVDYGVCELCGRYFDENNNILEDVIIPALGHNYGEWTKEVDPTFETCGSLISYCIFDGCQSSKSKEIPILNTSDYQYEVIIEATCLAEGIAQYTYKIDEQVLVYEIVLELAWHQSEEWIETVEATCETSGIKGHYQCVVCDKLYIDNEEMLEEDLFIEPIGHTGGEATCVEAAICENCGEAYGSIDANNHQLEDTYSFDDESHWYACGCGMKFSEANHSGDWEVIVEATKDSEGLEELTCDECGHRISQVIEKIPSGGCASGCKGGCKGSLASSFLGLITLAATAYFLSKKKELNV